MKRKNGKSKKKSRAGLAAAIVTAVLLIGAYAAGAVWFSSRLTPRTSVCGVDVSLMTKEQAKAAVTDSMSGYTLTLIEQDCETETLDCASLGLDVEFSGEFDERFTVVSGLAWPADIILGTDIPDSSVTLTCDENTLSDTLDSLRCVSPEKVVEVKDAAVEMIGGKYLLTPENPGNKADKEALSKLIMSAVGSRTDSIDLMSAGLYDMPDIYSDDADLQSRFTACKKLNDVDTVLSFGDSTETIDTPAAAQWASIDKESDGSYSVTFDNQKIKDYADELGDKYDTFGKPIVLKTHAGSTIDITTGDYGWLLDREYAAEQIMSILENGSSGTIDLTADSSESKAWWYRRVNRLEDVGSEYYKDAYIEVSISQQHMWVYKNGKVALESDIVTGKPDNVHDTPKGAFRIYSHESPSILRGADYTTEVSYWIPFAYEVGFHDAVWQPYFGGSLYLTNGSHGCVNMPMDSVKTLYGMIYDGMPVFVY